MCKSNFVAEVVIVSDNVKLINPPFDDADGSSVSAIPMQWITMTELTSASKAVTSSPSTTPSSFDSSVPNDKFCLIQYFRVDPTVTWIRAE